MKEDKFNIKEEYNNLRHKLPKFEGLDEEFEISIANIKEKAFLLRSIRRRLNDKVIFYCRIIEGLIYPNQNNMIGMFEIKSFSEDEKQILNDYYKKLMKYERESLSLDVNPDEKKDAEYINNLFKEWQYFKKYLIAVTDKMKSSWQTEDKPFRNNYFG